MQITFPSVQDGLDPLVLLGVDNEWRDEFYLKAAADKLDLVKQKQIIVDLYTDGFNVFSAPSAIEWRALKNGGLCADFVFDLRGNTLLLGRVAGRQKLTTGCVAYLFSMKDGEISPSPVLRAKVDKDGYFRFFTVLDSDMALVVPASREDWAPASAIVDQSLDEVVDIGLLRFSLGHRIKGQVRENGIPRPNVVVEATLSQNVLSIATPIQCGSHLLAWFEGQAVARKKRVLSGADGAFTIMALCDAKHFIRPEDDFEEMETRIHEGAKEALGIHVVSPCKGIILDMDTSSLTIEVGPIRRADDGSMHVSGDEPPWGESWSCTLKDFHGHATETFAGDASLSIMEQDSNRREFLLVPETTYSLHVKAPGYFDYDHVFLSPKAGKRISIQVKLVRKDK